MTKQGNPSQRFEIARTLRSARGPSSAHAAGRTHTSATSNHASRAAIRQEPEL